MLVGFALWRYATIRDAAAAASVTAATAGSAGSATSELSHDAPAALDDGASAVGDGALAIAADSTALPRFMPSPTLMGGTSSFQERVVGAPAVAAAAPAVASGSHACTRSSTSPSSFQGPPGSALIGGFRNSPISVLKLPMNL